jgi:hypothetical protein
MQEMQYLAPAAGAHLMVARRTDHPRGGLRSPRDGLKQPATLRPLRGSASLAAARISPPLDAWIPQARQHSPRALVQTKQQHPPSMSFLLILTESSLS